jgi:hypothetical protein
LKWYDNAHELDDMSAIADRTRLLAKALGWSSAPVAILKKTGGGVKP